METTPTGTHKQDHYILKSNLWKFFKALRAQANPIYCLLAASPMRYAWISIHDKADAAAQRRITIAQFVNSLKKIPATDKHYRLSIRLYDPSTDRSSTYEATFLHDLSVESIREMLPSMIAVHCEEGARQGVPFELTSQIIGHYKFKTRYIDALQSIITRCNHILFTKSEQTHL